MSKVDPEKNGQTSNGLNGSGHIASFRGFFDESPPTPQFALPQVARASAVTSPTLFGTSPTLFGTSSAFEHSSALVPLTYTGSAQGNLLVRCRDRYKVPNGLLYEAAAYFITLKFRQEALSHGARKNIRVSKMVDAFIGAIQEAAQRTDPLFKSIVDIMSLGVTLQPSGEAMVRLNHVRSSLNHELAGSTVGDFSIRSVGEAHTQRDNNQLARVARELRAGNEIIRELSSGHQLPSLEVLPSVVDEITEPILRQMFPLLEKFIEVSRAKHGSNTPRFISDLACVMSLAAYQACNVATIKLFQENGVYDAEKLNFSDTFILSYWRRNVLIQLIPFMRQHGMTSENIQQHISTIKDFELHDDAGRDARGRSMYILMDRAMGMMALTEEFPFFLREDDNLRNFREVLPHSSLLDTHIVHPVSPYKPANLLVLPALDSVSGILAFQCDPHAENVMFNFYVEGEEVRFKGYSNGQLRLGEGRMGVSFYRYLTTPPSAEDRAMVEAFTEEQYRVRVFVAKLQTEYPALFNPHASWAPLIVVCHPDGPIVVARADEEVLLSIPLKDLSLISEDDLSWGPLPQLIERRHAAFYLDKFSSPKRKAMIDQVQREREQSVEVKPKPIILTHDTMHRLGLFLCYAPARGDESKSLLAYGAPLIRVGNKSEEFEIDVSAETLKDKNVELELVVQPRSAQSKERSCDVVLLTAARRSLDNIPTDPRQLVVKRLQAIVENGHFGIYEKIKHLPVNNLYELKVGGHRVYYWRIGKCCIVSQIGSKGEQVGDIRNSLKDQSLAYAASDAVNKYLSNVVPRV